VRRRIAPVAAALAASLLIQPAAGAGDFASVVLAYAPAPGQFVNAPAFNDPSRALGPPTGGGSASPDNSGLVTLGGFGGSITLAFDHPVLDDPRNAMGLDCIVFGNAFWPSGDPTARAAEAGVIEIALDANGNGIADDAWYLIPGSHLAPPVARQDETWDDDPATPTPPAVVSWFPAGATSPMTTAAFRLPAVFESAFLISEGAPAETFAGYADLSPTLILGDMTGADGSPGDNSLADPEDDPAIDPSVFYTTPDDPLTVGIDPGSGGGDAFDIAWAVEPATGAPANLPGFHFIRISTGVHAIAGPLGEVSTEIDAVADVRPAVALPEDLTGDGAVDGRDITVVLNLWGARVSFADLNGDGTVNGADITAILNAWRPAP